MKRMRFLFMLSAVTLSSIVITSCKDDDGYSLDKYWLSIATIKTDGLEGDDYYLQRDNGSKLWVASQNFFYRPKNNQRAMVNYTLLSDQVGDYDHFVRVNGISHILTKGIIELNAQNADSIGNDKLEVEDIWVGSDYLNIIFGYNTSNNGVIHYINLVDNTTLTPASSDTVYLELRHNARSDIEQYGARGIVSFYLPSIDLSDKEESIFKIKVKTYRQGEKFYVVKYAHAGTSANTEYSSSANLTIEEVSKGNTFQ
ncbi:MAG: NigD-like protein [Bacteroidales bacterium]